MVERQLLCGFLVCAFKGHKLWYWLACTRNIVQRSAPNFSRSRRIREKENITTDNVVERVFSSKKIRNEDFPHASGGCSTNPSLHDSTSIACYAVNFSWHLSEEYCRLSIVARERDSQASACLLEGLIDRSGRGVRFTLTPRGWSWNDIVAT